MASDDSSSRWPSHPGASPTASVSERYADTDVPSVTSVGPGRPSPPGESIVITAAAVVRRAADPNSRAGQWC